MARFTLCLRSALCLVVLVACEAPADITGSSSPTPAAPQTTTPSDPGTTPSDPEGEPKPKKPGKPGPSGTTGPTGQQKPRVCTPGDSRECSSFPSAQRGVGRCKSGMQACLADGTGYDSCLGEVPPITEVCGNQVDDDCDGKTDENLDEDHDGYTECQGDCCDAPGACSATPELVNPGAFEVLHNGVDDDCNSQTADNVATSCEPLPLTANTTATDLAHAFDVCTGLVSAELLAADGKTIAIPKTQYGVLGDYGPNVTPRASSVMAALSSGKARDATDPDYSGTSVDCGTTTAIPQVYAQAHGGQLQTTASCSSSTDLTDSANLRLKLKVPSNAKGIAFRFKFYSSEWPEWVCTKYNDFFMALLSTKASGLPADHNISFDAQKNPVSVNNAFFEVCDPNAGSSACPAGTSELDGTGIAGPQLDDGGGTRWLETTAPVTPGETITLELMIWDTGDHSYDSLVLLDDFRWLPNPASVGTHPD